MSADIKHHGAFKWNTAAIDRVLDKPRNKMAEVMRECLKRELKRAFDTAEAALDRCRAMQRDNLDITEELAEAEVTLKAFLVAVMAIQHEQQRVTVQE